ncbi:MAG TPA: 50S ribosomal protein L11 [Phycisphaerales bacterium]|nr:50S ribosomal protein L11 [Phycisphaerales bacterium]
MGKREVTNVFKIMATGGAATPAPPLGPVLGSKGVNPGQFVQKFNAATQHVKGKVVGCIVTVYSDRTFDLEVKSSPASAMIKDEAKIEKGSGVPNKQKNGTLSKAQVRKIAEAKMQDLNANSVEAAMRIIEGTARSMGVMIGA